MSDLREAQRVLEGLGDSQTVQVLAAVSGGLDSMCLLHLLQQYGLSVTAAHFNHGLRGALADRDEAFVQEICMKWKIPFVAGRGDTRELAEKEGLSIEEAARKLRYTFLEEQARERNCTHILTAHHADDNAETMLLNLLRGTGARGLIGIPAIRDSIIRPFLRVTREELTAYAAEHDIPHVEDETNQELDAARNVLRHKVLPVLRELNPRAVENMARAAELLMRDEEALDDQAEQLVRDHARLQGDCLAELPVAICTGRSQAVVSRALLRMMAYVAGRRQDFSRVHVEAAMKLLYHGHMGQEASLPYGMKVFRRDESIVIQKEPCILPEEVTIVPGRELTFGDWRVSLGEPVLSQGAYCYNVSLPESGTLTVSCWKSTDRMRVSGGRGSRSVKRLAADSGISYAERDRLPVLRMDGCPVAIPGIGVNEEITPDENKKTILVTFLKQTEEKHHEK